MISLSNIVFLLMITMNFQYFLGNFGRIVAEETPFFFAASLRMKLRNCQLSLLGWWRSHGICSGGGGRGRRGLISNVTGAVYSDLSPFPFFNMILLCLTLMTSPLFVDFPVFFHLSTLFPQKF